LTDIADSLSNSVHYTLDGLGNCTQEETKDPNHALAQTVFREAPAILHDFTFTVHKVVSTAANASRHNQK
jgi:hypothetical protein